MLGTFASRDPLGHRSAVNFFGYASNSPTGRTDPTGLLPPDGNNWTDLHRSPPLMPPQRPTPPVRRPGLRHGPAVWSPPDGLLTRRERCPHLDPALEIANSAVNSGSCRDWFDDRVENHGADPPDQYDIWIVPHLFGNTGVTFPIFGDNNLYLLRSSCCAPISVLAQLIVHEMAHHYCPPYGDAGEDCANEGQNVCMDEIMNATLVAGHNLQPTAPCRRCPIPPGTGFPAFEPKF